MLEFFSCKAETSTSCHRVLGNRAWLTLMGNKGSLHSPRSGKFRDESEKRKLENKDASFASDTHPSWDSVQRPGSREQNRALFILSAPIVPVPTAGPEPRGLTGGSGGGRRQRPEPLPAGSRPPLVVSAHGRARRDLGPGCPRDGLGPCTTHGDPPALPGRLLDLFVQPQHSPGAGAAVWRGVPPLSPPAPRWFLLRLDQPALLLLTRFPPRGACKINRCFA